MLLLHTCCAPCSAAIIEWLLANDIQPTLYYYNPNIFTRKESQRSNSGVMEGGKTSRLKPSFILLGDMWHSFWTPVPLLCNKDSHSDVTGLGRLN